MYKTCIRPRGNRRKAKLRDVGRRREDGAPEKASSRARMATRTARKVGMRLLLLISKTVPLDPQATPLQSPLPSSRQNSQLVIIKSLATEFSVQAGQRPHIPNQISLLTFIHKQTESSVIMRTTRPFLLSSSPFNPHPPPSVLSPYFDIVVPMPFSFLPSPPQSADGGPVLLTQGLAPFLLVIS